MVGPDCSAAATEATAAASAATIRRAEALRLRMCWLLRKQPLDVTAGMVTAAFAGALGGGPSGLQAIGRCYDAEPYITAVFRHQPRGLHRPWSDGAHIGNHQLRLRRQAAALECQRGIELIRAAVEPLAQALALEALEDVALVHLGIADQRDHATFRAIPGKILSAKVILHKRGEQCLRYPSPTDPVEKSTSSASLVREG